MIRTLVMLASIVAFSNAALAQRAGRFPQRITFNMQAAPTTGFFAPGELLLDAPTAQDSGQYTYTFHWGASRNVCTMDVTVTEATISGHFKSCMNVSAGQANGTQCAVYLKRTGFRPTRRRTGSVWF